MSDVRVLLFGPAFDLAVVFYRDVLGGLVVTAWDDDTGRGSVLRLGGGSTCIELIEHGGRPSGVALAIEVLDVDDEHDRLLARGVTITVPVADQPWGHRNLSITDPNGVVVTLFTPIS